MGIHSTKCDLFDFSFLDIYSFYFLFFMFIFMLFFSDFPDLFFCSEISRFAPPRLFHRSLAIPLSPSSSSFWAKVLEWTGRRMDRSNVSSSWFGEGLYSKVTTRPKNNILQKMWWFTFLLFFGFLIVRFWWDEPTFQLGDFLEIEADGSMAVQLQLVKSQIVNCPPDD